MALRWDPGFGVNRRSGSVLSKLLSFDTVQVPPGSPGQTLARADEGVAPHR
jgi:hypothetical protein